MPSIGSIGLEEVGSAITNFPVYKKGRRALGCMGQRSRERIQDGSDTPSDTSITLKGARTYSNQYRMYRMYRMIEMSIGTNLDKGAGAKCMPRH